MFFGKMIESFNSGMAFRAAICTKIETKKLVTYIHFRPFRKEHVEIIKLVFSPKAGWEKNDLIWLSVLSKLQYLNSPKNVFF